MTIERKESLVWRHDIDNLLEGGVWLGVIGVRNWALFTQDALSVLEEFRKQQIAVLGGDVYTIKEGKPKPSRDNWYFDIKSADADSASIEKAKIYIVEYDRRNPNALFSLVPKVE